MSRINWFSRSTCSSIWSRKRRFTVSSWRAQSISVSVYALIEASGVLSSWEALATKSCRIRSSRRRSVTSWKTSTAPDGGFPGKGSSAHGENPRRAAQRGFAEGERHLALVGIRVEQPQCLIDGALNLRTADQLRHQPAYRRGIEAEQGIGAGVGKQQRLRASTAITASAIAPSTTRNCWRSSSSRSMRAWIAGAASLKTPIRRPTGPHTLIRICRVRRPEPSAEPAGEFADRARPTPGHQHRRDQHRQHQGDQNIPHRLPRPLIFSDRNTLPVSVQDDQRST